MTSRTDYKISLDSITQEVKSVADNKVQSILTSLLNLVEALIEENEQLRAENQRLRDEINRLKGEQGKPDIRKQTQGKQDISSENERNNSGKNGKKQKKKFKKKTPLINRTEIVPIDKSTLPPDAIFKGYEPATVQDILITTNNVLFQREVYYSKSLGKTFMAPVPAGYEGGFGPGIKSTIIALYHDLKMTEFNLHKFFETYDIQISAGTISGILIKNKTVFHDEKQAIIAAGLQSTPFQQMDDTSARVRGKNYYVHVLCNPLYSAYFTCLHKDRLTIIDILTQHNVRFTFNEQAFSLMKDMQLSQKIFNQVTALCAGKTFSRAEMDTVLTSLFPNPKKQQTNRQIILDCAAIAAYQLLPFATSLLLTDDAPQYNKIAQYHPLCWVHDGRHYKKLNPISYLHREKLDVFLTQYWDYYAKLRDYKEAPTTELAILLEKEFDTLFSTTTGYEKLDERIAKTKAKKNQLLLVLTHPYLPLHNNDSELGAREQARRRDISFHTMTAEGTEAKDTFMTIAQTTRKLAVNFFHYIYDRISKKYQMPSLASLIQQHAILLP